MRVRERIRGKWQGARALARFVRSFRNWPAVWGAYRSGQPLPPLVLAGGLTLYHGVGDDPLFLFREIFVERCYTHGGFYRPRPSDTVLDIGANIGVFALYLQSRARGVRVRCFEPSAATRLRLERNITANGLEIACAVYPYAVSNRAGEARLKQAALAGKFSLFERADGADQAGEETVQCLSLRQALALADAPTIDLLKVDVEGAEIEIFEEDDPALWGRIRRVAVEYHDLFRPGCRDRVTRTLAEQGFARIEVLPFAGNPDIGIIRARRAGRG